MRVGNRSGLQVMSEDEEGTGAGEGNVIEGEWVRRGRGKGAGE